VTLDLRHFTLAPARNCASSENVAPVFFVEFAGWT
jgi:hypothetical protein